MGTLVNPIGWRTNSNIYWKTNFFVTDDQRFGLLSNNLSVYSKVLTILLTKFNKLFKFRGFLKFVSHNEYVYADSIVVFIRFRFYSNTRMRFKLFRRYKYVRRDFRKSRFFHTNFGYWIKSSLIRIKELRKSIEKLKKKLKFFNQNIRYVPLYLDRKRLRKMRDKCEIELLSTIHRFENLRMRVFYASYRLGHTWRWSRNFRILFKMREYRLSRRSWRPFTLFYYQRKKLYKDLFRFRKNNRKKKFLVQFTDVVRDLGFSKLKRMSHFVPKNGIFLHHRKLIRRLYQIRQRKKVRLRSKWASKKRFSISRKARKARILPYIQRKKLTRRRRRRIFFNTKFLKKGLRRSSTKGVQPRSFHKKKQVWQNNSRYKFRFRRRYKKRWNPWRRWRGRWRQLVEKKDKRRQQFFHRSLVIFFRILPFFLEVKLFVQEILKRSVNLRQLNLYMLNVSKPYAVTAALILEFVENFLRRRRRVTKINKLFYRIMKFIRFFRAKYHLRGFKLMLAGRFLRRDRATFIWRTRGAVPLSTKLAKIDFAIRPMQMKYSRPVAKLWLCRR